MTTGDRQDRKIRMKLQRRCWLALPTALLANALLFCVLAGARTTPSRARVPETKRVRITVMDWPSLDSAAAEAMPSEPDLIAIAVQETSMVTTEAITEIATALSPRLPNGTEAISSDLVGLPVLLPGLSDLRSVPSPSATGFTEPLSLSGVDRVPKRIAGAFPRYPRWARNARLTGSVTLRFIITEAGTITNVNIHHIEGDERFGREAIRAVTAWRFDPATKRGEPVACWCFQKINFTLDN